MIILLLVLGCTRSSDERKIKELLSKYNKEISLYKKPIIIIPLYGCGTCVEKVVKFMKSEYSKGKFTFVVSAIYKKDFSIRLGEIIASPYIIYDTLNFALAKELISNSPIMYIKDKKLKSLVLQTNQDYIEMDSLLNVTVQINK